MPRQTFLPTDLPTPPIYSKTNPADAPILTLALTSDATPLSQVEDLADTRLAQKISQLPGVGLVSISGGQKPAVRIQVNPDGALFQRNQSGRCAHGDCSQTSLDLGEGKFRRPAPGLSNRRERSALTSGTTSRSVVVAYRNGAPVLLSDVANVVGLDGIENVKQAAWMNDTPAVIVNIQRQPGANIIQVVNSIQKLLPVLTDTACPPPFTSRF